MLYCCGRIVLRLGLSWPCLAETWQTASTSIAGREMRLISVLHSFAVILVWTERYHSKVRARFLKAHLRVVIRHSALERCRLESRMSHTGRLYFARVFAVIFPSSRRTSLRECARHSTLKTFPEALGASHASNWLARRSRRK